MRGFVPPDPQGGVSKVQFAVVYAPRRKRRRFTAGCVTPVASREEALASAEPAKKRYAVQVLGPSKSSEGQYVYYLVEWLSEG